MTLKLSDRVYVRINGRHVAGRVTELRPRGRVEVTTAAGPQEWPSADVLKAATVADLVSLAALALVLLATLLVLFSD